MCHQIILGEGSPSPHQQGQLEVLRARFSSSHVAVGEHWLDRTALATVQMQCINPKEATRSPRVHIPLPNADLPCPADPPTILQETLLPRVQTVASALADLVQGAPTKQALASQTNQLLCLRQRLREWEASVHEAWRFKIVPKAMSPLPEPRNLFSPAHITFPSVSVAGVWLAYWLARLTVLRSLSSILPLHLASCPPPELSMADVRAEMLNTATFICSSIPAIIGADDSGEADSGGQGIGAFFATGALYITAGLPGLPDDQVAWALDKLEFIGRERGIRHALVRREELLRARSERLAER